MQSIVETLARFNFHSANIILESNQKMGNLWLGDFTAAIDKRWQQTNGIVAVLTVAHGLNIEPAPNVVHKEINAFDVEHYDIQKNFDEGCEFIQTWLPKGSVLGLINHLIQVHCAAGVSRSASMIICYLMRINKWSVSKCFSFVKCKRKVICPNPGFMVCLKKEEQLLGIKKVGSQNHETYNIPQTLSTVRRQSNFVIRGFQKSTNSKSNTPVDRIPVKLQQINQKLKKESLNPLRPPRAYKL